MKPWTGRLHSPAHHSQFSGLYSEFSLYTEASQQVAPTIATPELLVEGSDIPQQKSPKTGYSAGQAAMPGSN